MAGNDDKARETARDIIRKYQVSLSNIGNSVRSGGTTPKEAARYRADARKDAAQRLGQLAKAKGVSSEMRKRIERAAQKAKGDTSSSHGAWWASSGSSDNPGGWI